ncbi:MAG: hypothetical protein V4560_03470 [Bacteroidota bacterium]
MSDKKEKPKAGRPENYEKSELKINGTFDQVIKAAFDMNKTQIRLNRLYC